MAKIKNKYIHGTVEEIKAAKEEADFIGRNVSRITNNGRTLVLYAIPPKKRTRKPKDEVTIDKERRASRRGNGYNKYREFN